MKTSGTLLLVLPLPIYQTDQGLFIDSQAANGLEQWLNHFTSITLCVKSKRGPAESDCVPIHEKNYDGRLNIVTLPDGWTPTAHFKALRRVRKILSGLIDRHDYLHFALMGGWGDWSSVGVDLAKRKGLKCCVWTDRVESEVIALDAARHTGVRRLSRLANAWVARWNERRAIKRAALGLFHGKDTFERFNSLSPNPRLVHDIHLKPADRITPAELHDKIATCAEGPLKIVYAGRVHPDKGPREWIETLKLSRDGGADFQATWFGRGPDLDEARALVERLGLSQQVSFPGPVDDRRLLLAELRSAHLMLFCHLTPESPRCLIEALITGTPIVGFGTAYSQDLIAQNRGGCLTDPTPAALSAELIAISRDRARLATLINCAARDGYDMNDEAVFAHRVELMRTISKARS